MKSLIESVLYVFFLCVGALLLFLLMPVVGGAAGWVFAIIFEDSFAALQGLLHTDASGFQIGAALGFVASFFRNVKGSDK